MSNQNDGFQEQKGYEPPGGSQADEQRRAREAQEQQRVNEQYQRDQEAIDRNRKEDDLKRRDWEKKQRDQRKGRGQDGGGSSNGRGGPRTKPSEPLVKNKKQFNSTFATIAGLIVIIYTTGFLKMEFKYGVIAGVIAGILAGYLYRWVIGIGVVAILSYFFMLNPEQKRSLTGYFNKTISPQSHTTNATTSPSSGSYESGGASTTFAPTPQKTIEPPRKPVAPQPTTIGASVPASLLYAPYSFEEAMQLRKSAIKTVEDNVAYLHSIKGDAVTFKKITENFNSSRLGRQGMEVTVDVHLNYLPNENALLFLNIFYEDGRGVGTTSKFSQNPLTKQLAGVSFIPPQSGKTDYVRYRVFLAYDAFQFPKGTSIGLLYNLTIQHRSMLWGRPSEFKRIQWNK